MPEGTELTPLNPMPDGHLFAERRRAAVGLALRRGEEALRAHGRGLRRLLRVHRPPGRPDRRLPRGDRAAREHDHPLLRRQRRLGRGQRRTARSTRTCSSTAGRTRSRRTSSTSTTSAARAPTTTTRPAGRSRSRRRSRCSSATRTQGGDVRPARHPLAGRDQGQGRGAPPVPPRDRHRPDDPRVLRPGVPEHAERARAGTAAACRCATRSTRQTRATPKKTPVLRDARHARHLGPGLEGRCRPRAALGDRATTTRTSGSSSTSRMTAPRRRTSPRSSRKRSRSWSSSGSRRRASTTSSRWTTVSRRDPQRPAPAARGAARHVRLLPGHRGGPGGGRGVNALAARTRSSPTSSTRTRRGTGSRLQAPFESLLRFERGGSAGCRGSLTPGRATRVIMLIG